jgi:hypothetical protein
MRPELAAGEVALKNPIRRTFFGCCAWAGAQSAKSRAQSSHNIRAIGILEWWKNVFSHIAQYSRIPVFHYSGFSFDHLVRSRQSVWRDRLTV